MNTAPCVFQFLTDKIWWKNVKGSWGLARGKPHVWGIRLAVTSMISCWHLSNEKSPGCLGYIWDFTTHLHRDYDTPLEGPLWKNHYNGKLEGFFVAHFYVFRVLLQVSIRDRTIADLKEKHDKSVLHSWKNGRSVLPALRSPSTCSRKEPSQTDSLWKCCLSASSIEQHFSRLWFL